MESDRTILVVEDEDDIAILLTKRLESEGFSVTRVADGVQAMQAAMRIRPSLVVLDLMLPGGGGLSVLRKIRRSYLTQSIPVVVLTGMQDSEHKAEVLEAGVEAYLEKPYDPAELVSVINRVIN